jgi:hypothetical protein
MGDDSIDSTARNRGLLEKLGVPSDGQENTRLYGTLRFIIVFTRTLHWSLSWTVCIQATHSQYFPKIHFNIILPYTARYSEKVKLGLSAPFCTIAIHTYLQRLLRCLKYLPPPFLQYLIPLDPYRGFTNCPNHLIRGLTKFRFPRSL